VSARHLDAQDLGIEVLLVSRQEGDVHHRVHVADCGDGDVRAPAGTEGAICVCSGRDQQGFTVTGEAAFAA